MTHSREEKLEAIGKVADTLDILRVKCPWDRKQTFESLRPNTIEEVYELCDALAHDDMPAVRKELGDVLLHVLFYAKIAQEKDLFDIADVADTLNAKLIFRHPHVFGQTKAETAHDVELNWEQIKLRERDGNKSVLAGVPRSLPALIKAYRIQEKAANVGFDWADRTQVWQKVKEEISEFETEAATADQARMADEFGDVMFSLINAARLYGINPENALEHTCQKFISRFNHIEESAKESGTELRDMTLDRMEELWQEAKKSDK